MKRILIQTDEDRAAFMASQPPMPDTPLHRAGAASEAAGKVYGDLLSAGATEAELADALAKMNEAFDVFGAEAMSVLKLNFDDPLT